MHIIRVRKLQKQILLILILVRPGIKASNKLFRKVRLYTYTFQSGCKKTHRSRGDTVPLRTTQTAL